MRERERESVGAKKRDWAVDHCSWRTLQSVYVCVRIIHLHSSIFIHPLIDASIRSIDRIVSILSLSFVHLLLLIWVGVAMDIYHFEPLSWRKEDRIGCTAYCKLRSLAQSQPTKIGLSTTTSFERIIESTHTSVHACYHTSLFHYSIHLLLLKVILSPLDHMIQYFVHHFSG